MPDTRVKVSLNRIRFYECANINISQIGGLGPCMSSLEQCVVRLRWFGVEIMEIMDYVESSPEVTDSSPEVVSASTSLESGRLLVNATPHLRPAPPAPV